MRYVCQYLKQWHGSPNISLEKDIAHVQEEGNFPEESIVVVFIAMPMKFKSFFSNSKTATQKSATPRSVQSWKISSCGGIGKYYQCVLNHYNFENKLLDWGIAQQNEAND